jgi:hypothetical protein
MDRKKAAIAIVAAASLMGGCSVYTDASGRPYVGSAFDQAAIKAELQQAEKEYGSR